MKRTMVSMQYPVVSISEINQKAKANPVLLVEESERYYNNQLRKVVEQVHHAEEPVSIILLAGPSASGKTTTAHRLKRLLVEQGHQSSVVSLDDFYFNNCDIPLDEKGEKDFETIDSLDVALINHCLSELLTKGKSNLPRFNFHQGKRVSMDHTVSLGKGDVILVEGIHGLNPLLTDNIASAGIKKVYVSARTRFVDTHGNILLNPVDTRLIRRMVRDIAERSTPPEQTLKMWNRVCIGEAKYIRPFKEMADFDIDTTLDYEPCIFHNYLAPILQRRDMASEQYRKLIYLYGLLFLFYDIDDQSTIPQNSIIREFIGK